MLLSEQLVARKVPEGSTWTWGGEDPHDSGAACFLPVASTGHSSQPPRTEDPLERDTWLADLSQVALGCIPWLGQNFCSHFTGKKNYQPGPVPSTVQVQTDFFQKTTLCWRFFLAAFYR